MAGTQTTSGDSIPSRVGCSEMRGPEIVPSEAHFRPSVIASRQKDVDLVAAVGAILVLPHLPGARGGRSGRAYCDAPGCRSPADSLRDRRTDCRGGTEPSSLRRRTLPRRLLKSCATLARRPGPAAGGQVDLAVTPEGDTAVETRVARVTRRGPEGPARRRARGLPAGPAPAPERPCCFRPAWCT